MQSEFFFYCNKLHWSDAFSGIACTVDLNVPLHHGQDLSMVKTCIEVGLLF